MNHTSLRSIWNTLPISIISSTSLNTFILIDTIFINAQFKLSQITIKPSLRLLLGMENTRKTPNPVDRSSKPVELLF
uniref:Uncharacterized protein n=1 Tax=Picea glauca TaxID=3330 RepID=A0A124GN89_PICGL|nr:hypothetical protein ABT39_MTgene5029 [Picea glauca]